MNGYTFRKGNLIVFIFASSLNGASAVKVKSFLVGSLKERICFKGSRLFQSKGGPHSRGPSFSEPTGISKRKRRGDVNLLDFYQPKMFEIHV